MNQIAEFFGMCLAVLLFALPLGVVVGIAGERSWIAFWTVALILIAIATLLFVNPVHHSGADFMDTAAMATSGIIVDGLLFRAGLRAMLRLWKRRGHRAATEA